MDNNTFTIAPTNQQISLSPGQTYEASINIISPSGATSDFHYQAVVTPYSVLGDDYIINLSDESEHTSISKWISIAEPTGTIKPNESKELKFTITVPKDAPAGGQYATIAVSSSDEVNSQEGVNIQNILEIASIIYVNINGEVIHEGYIEENHVPEFAFATPVSVGATIVNTGNTHETARINITATDLLNGQAFLPSSLDSGQYDEFIMPGTTRYISHDIPDLPDFGIFKVYQSVRYQDTTSVTEKTLIVCPAWFIALVTLTIIAVITTIIVLVRKHRRKKPIII